MGVVIPIGVARRRRTGLCAPASGKGATVIELTSRGRRSAPATRAGKPRQPRNGDAA
jgi:hypothetical protein